MLLTAVQGIRESLGFDDMTDINFAIEAALHAAEPQLAAQLGTSFARTAVTDTFFVPRPGYEDGRHVQTEFRLSRGLVVPTPVAIRAYDPQLIDTEGRAVDGVRYDFDKGIARDWMTHYEGEYVRFSYEAGFEVGAEPQTYDLTQVPTLAAGGRKAPGAAAPRRFPDADRGQRQAREADAVAAAQGAAFRPHPLRPDGAAADVRRRWRRPSTSPSSSATSASRTPRPAFAPLPAPSSRTGTAPPRC